MAVETVAVDPATPKRRRRVRKLAGRVNLVASALLAFAIWVLVSIIATTPGFKWLFDVSPQAQFSVTAETEKLIDQIRADDLTLEVQTFYMRLPSAVRSAREGHLLTIHRRLHQLTTDLLMRYASLGGAAVEVTHFDLDRDITGSREALQEVGGTEDANVVVVKLGGRHRKLSIHYDMAEIEEPGSGPQVPGAQQAQPRLKNYKGEEALSSAIRSLMIEGTPKVYFLTGYDGPALTQARGDSYSELANALEGEGFDVRGFSLTENARIPEDAAIVALMEPTKPLPPQHADQLYGYVKRGGRLLLNVSFSTVPGWNPTFPRLGKLLGFRIGEQPLCHLVPDPRMPSAAGVGGITEVFNIYAQEMLRHPVTEPLIANSRTPLLKNCRPIFALDERPDGITIQNGILKSGKWGWLASHHPTTGDVDLDAPSDPNAYDNFSVGAAITVSPDEGSEVAAEGRVGQVALIGGIAFLNQGFAYNGDLALNVFNWLARRDALVTVRGNKYRSKRLQLLPHQIDASRSLMTVWVPIGLAMLAFVVLFMRRRQ